LTTQQILFGIIIKNLKACTLLEKNSSSIQLQGVALLILF